MLTYAEREVFIHVMAAELRQHFCRSTALTMALSALAEFRSCDLSNNSIRRRLEEEVAEDLLTVTPPSGKKTRSYGQ